MATSADKDDRDNDENDEKDAAEGDVKTSEKKTATAPKATDAKAAAVAGDKDDDEDDAADDEDDEKDTAEGDAKTSEKKTATAPKATDAKAAAVADDKDDKDDDDDDDDDEDDEEEEEAKPAPKPAASLAKGAASAKGAAKGAAKPGAGKGAPVAAKRVAAPPGGKLARGKPLAPRQAGSLGKTLILFVFIVGGLAAAFAVLGREDNAPPKWSVGQTIDLDITLVPSDATHLACAAPDEIAGKHCAFEAANKPWSKGDSKDDKTLLRPYMTTNNMPFFGAGLWSEPALSASALPKDDTRFTAHCKFKVEGPIKKAQVRWKVSDPWYDWNELRYAGTISGCRVTL